MRLFMVIQFFVLTLAECEWRSVLLDSLSANLVVDSTSAEFLCLVLIT
ncbi:hypothetical protein M758_3G023100 [Ceratodon purpureus]|nr:hypothetical protein M758_3G023100 [Ceratodon purpureus]